MHTAREEDPSNRRLTCCKPQYRRVREIPKELCAPRKGRRHKALANLRYVCPVLASEGLIVHTSLIGHFLNISKRVFPLLLFFLPCFFFLTRSPRIRCVKQQSCGLRLHPCFLSSSVDGVHPCLLESQAIFRPLFSITFLSSSRAAAIVSVSLRLLLCFRRIKKMI